MANAGDKRKRPPTVEDMTFEDARILARAILLKYPLALQGPPRFWRCDLCEGMFQKHWMTFDVEDCDICSDCLKTCDYCGDAYIDESNHEECRRWLATEHLRPKYPSESESSSSESEDDADEPPPEANQESGTSKIDGSSVAVPDIVAGTGESN
jgi:hypothetical protein